MGIRIHKVLGYGLTDLQLNDDRLNLDCFSKHYKNAHYFSDEFDEKYSFENFKSFINDKYEQEKNLSFTEGKKLSLSFLKRDIEENKLGYFGSYNIFLGLFQEFHKKNLLLVTVPWYKDWYRYDNIIDYVEQSEVYGEPKDIILPLNDAIYPHISYTNLKTGEKFEDFSIIRAFNEIKFNKKIKEKDKPGFYDRLAKKVGFENYLDYYNNVKPETPDDIKLLCEFYNIFKDPKTVDTLRPILYTYWS